MNNNVRILDRTQYAKELFMELQKAQPKHYGEWVQWKEKRDEMFSEIGIFECLRINVPQEFSNASKDLIILFSIQISGDQTFDEYVDRVEEDIDKFTEIFIAF